MKTIQEITDAITDFIDAETRNLSPEDHCDVMNNVVEFAEAAIATLELEEGDEGWNDGEEE